MIKDVCTVGLSRGSVTITRYRVVGLRKKIKLNDLNERFTENQIKRVRLQGASKDLNWGWSRPQGLEDAFDDQDASWDLSHCRLGNGLILNFRVDKRKVPTRLLQMLAKERLRKRQQKKGKPLPAAERKQLWMETRDELLALALPDIQVVESYWDQDKAEVLLFSASKKSQQIFEELFVKSFCQHLGCALVKIDPPLQGLQTEEWENPEVAKDKLGRLSIVSPANFLEGHS